jgi:hypothetical protein
MPQPGSRDFPREMKHAAALLAALMTISCASHPAPTPAPLPTIHRIAIVPATDPRWLTFENAAPPIGYPFQFWVNKIDSHSKAYRFNEAVDPRKLALAQVITVVVAQRLRERGFEVEVLQDVARPADDPDSIDEDRIAATAGDDAIVHIWIDEVGMYSGHLSAQYVPRVNLRGKMWTKWRDDSLYSDEADYGVDARKGKSWAIFPDPRYHWGSFDELIANMQEVRAAYATGAQLAATRLTDQMAAIAGK